LRVVPADLRATLCSLLRRIGYALLLGDDLSPVYPEGQEEPFKPLLGLPPRLGETFEGLYNGQGYAKIYTAQGSFYCPGCRRVVTDRTPASHFDRCKVPIFSQASRAPVLAAITEGFSVLPIPDVPGGWPDVEDPIPLLSPWQRQVFTALKIAALKRVRGIGGQGKLKIFKFI